MCVWCFVFIFVFDYLFLLSFVVVVVMLCGVFLAMHIVSLVFQWAKEGLM